jgi:2-polyprenyl-3-methyl-5-hydroxy-6-metoxy-1,4-benzoquinol methylase
MTDFVDPEGNEARVIHELVDFHNVDVLEIGCGDGRLIRRYADFAGSVLGIDSVDSDIQRAQSLAPKEFAAKVSFQAVDALTADFAPAAFDVVVLGRSI